MSKRNGMTLVEQLNEFFCKFIKPSESKQDEQSPAAGVANTSPQASSPPLPTATSFLNDIAIAEVETLLPPLPPSLPDPNDPKYINDADAYSRDRQAAEAAAGTFTAAAKVRGAAVAQVISKWLATKPYAMFQELLAQPRDAHADLQTSYWSSGCYAACGSRSLFGTYRSFYRRPLFSRNGACHRRQNQAS
jgi:hypothetical protein